MCRENTVNTILLPESQRHNELTIVSSERTYDFLLPATKLIHAIMMESSG